MYIYMYYLFISEKWLRCHTQIGKGGVQAGSLCGGPCVVNFTAPSGDPSPIPMKLPMFAAWIRILDGDILIFEKNHQEPDPRISIN